MELVNRESPDSKTEGAAASREWSVLQAFRHRNYRLFFAGQLVSLIGTWMQSVAQSWLVYRLTGSAMMLGLVGFASQIPVFLVAPLGGAVSDRHNRRLILIAAQSASMLLAFALAALTLAHRVHVVHVFVLAAALGVVNAFDIPARQAFVVDMVGRDDLLNAIALNSSMFNGARIVGPALAGVLVASIGEGWCFFANAMSYLAVITGLLMMRITAQARVPLLGSALASIIEGFRFVWAPGPIRALLILLGIISLMGMPYVVLMPIFAGRIFHGGARELGLLMGASGVGALLGALRLAARQGVKGLGRWVALSAGAFGASLILFSLSRSFWLSAALLIPVGFSMMIEMAASNTLIQTMAPDHLRGRVMAVYSMMFMGMAPLGALLSGALADRIGAPVTVAIGGVFCIAGSVVFRVYLPALKVEARRMIVALRAAGGGPAEEVTGDGSAAAPKPGSEQHGHRSGEA
ncbi:MAG: MFS transporter [Nitrospirae bacterium CG_4_9_14_3_um_filter_53_35]|nr:MAG: MFS transporter [Nitrospirae bacterium CG2_30_53_67]PIS35951.1 MAG: MFS transporter [Nitrospirae bacterium CG08_land_8_20_14_0_20_52_24]PIV82563.1 MAG: MFS transporter [Nitrospirae bacterium CG17_big_fil_post_rev_8_21_14_2_50_50_9]PIW85597.1 MAG: MFS transporter [Nitrospirae bacterium CG_4_8_14_3_um_filter_50_41]PIX85177.1 MAG: MFS transporter [Nitrospirae bacterium CG_4_10_14_3_um_filter_53_41]PJA75816.1 MAG: MFS transporter [Nitrospirae bacterium CG_4_9_14_3_um_filter_53_35]